MKRSGTAKVIPEDNWQRAQLAAPVFNPFGFIGGFA
jgi:hypothetical protein